MIYNDSDILRARQILYLNKSAIVKKHTYSFKFVTHVS